MGLKFTTGDPENVAFLIQVVEVVQFEGRGRVGADGTAGCFRSEHLGTRLLVTSRRQVCQPGAVGICHRARQEPASH
jgi:hypothetical protein